VAIDMKNLTMTDSARPDLSAEQVKTAFMINDAIIQGGMIAGAAVGAGFGGPIGAILGALVGGVLGGIPNFEPPKGGT